MKNRGAYAMKYEKTDDIDTLMHVDSVYRALSTKRTEEVRGVLRANEQRDTFWDRLFYPFCYQRQLTAAAAQKVLEERKRLGNID